MFGGPFHLLEHHDAFFLILDIHYVDPFPIANSTQPESCLPNQSMIASLNIVVEPDLNFLIIVVLAQLFLRELELFPTGARGLSQDLTLVDEKLVGLAFAKYSEEWASPSKKPPPGEARKPLSPDLAQECSLLSLLYLLASDDQLASFFFLIIQDGPD